MNRMSIDHTFSRRALGAVALLAIGAACAEPLAHSNPLDRDADFVMSIVSLGDIIDGTQVELEFEATSTPALPPHFVPVISWSSATTTSLIRLNGSRFITSATMQPVEAEVVARLGFVEARHTFTVRQRAGSWTLSCRAPADCGAISGFAPEFFIEVAGTTADARLARNVGWAVENGTVTVRNLSVIEPHPSGGKLHFRPTHPGTTWIVFSFDGVADSVQVTVTP